MSTWQDLVTASLIGTERAPVPPVRIPGWPDPDNPAAGDKDAAKFTPDGVADQASVRLDPAETLLDPAEMLLDRAALLTAARRAGQPAGHAEPLPAAGPDLRPLVSPAAGDRLAWMLRGTHPD
ncbi:MAG TPA: hypothetical protein VHN16_11515, partial [Streptosporangiaceae bacterium]|nr:hypothetical protein [Streptosporangiaceae bacterium]